VARLLLVDDEADIREMLRDALAFRGHDVEVADSATKAIALAETKAYDVAIVDYVLPGMRGLDLLHRLHLINRFMRSVVMSGQLDHDVVEANELEKQLKEKIAADRYLPKPVAVETLNAAIEELCIASREANWKKLAADARDASKVKAKNVRDMDKKLSKSKKKRH